MAESTPARQQDYISTARQAARDLWTAYNTLLSLQSEWNAQDYAANLDDGAGSNEGIAAASVGSVVFDSANAIKTVMDAGNATNFTALL